MTDPRTVTDSDNVVWTCVQAYAGLTESRRTEADAVLATDDVVAVVCTPSGSAQSVRYRNSLFRKPAIPRLPPYRS